MSRRALRGVLIVALGLAAGCGGPEGPPAPGTTSAQAQTPGGFARALEGVWVSAALERVDRAGAPTTFRRRVFELGERDFRLAIDVFSDERAQERLMRLEFAGPWSVSAPSAAVAGAFEAEFGHDAWWLTPWSAALVERARATGCGDGRWEAGTRQEVSDRGCLGIASKADCPSEYDIVALLDGRLVFGERVVTPCRPDLRLSRLSSTDRFVRATASYDVTLSTWGP